MVYTYTVLGKYDVRALPTLGLYTHPTKIQYYSNRSFIHNNRIKMLLFSNHITTCDRYGTGCMSNRDNVTQQTAQSQYIGEKRADKLLIEYKQHVYAREC